MIPTEPIGSIARPAELIHGIEAFSAGRISRSDLDVLYHSAIRNTIERFEATGSPVITDGEQGKEQQGGNSLVQQGRSERRDHDRVVDVQAAVHARHGNRRPP